MDLKRPKPVVLIVLDGWGDSPKTEHNAIAKAQKPNWEWLVQEGTSGVIQSSGLDVGLPEGQMGNSEVGHMNLGAGRIIYQDFTRITKAIQDTRFFKNPVLQNALEKAKEQDSALHILGLLSEGGVHSHADHIFALIKMAHYAGLKKIYLHAFLDGRDTPPKSAEASLAQAQQLFDTLQCGQIASLIGRYYAMDRDKRWERTKIAYELLMEGKAFREAPTAMAGLAAAYASGETDEFIQATRITSLEKTTLQPEDVVVFMNFRADRARQLTRALTQTTFAGFDRPLFHPPGLCVTLTPYAKDIACPAAFAQVAIQNGLGEYLALHGFSQLRIAETEKYAHVTFFFNGGVETPYPKEERILIPSPAVATYDLTPEMSAPLLTQKLTEAILQDKFDFILCNFANPDMVGHTGNFSATVKAIETIDDCLGKIHEALKKRGGEMIITADHGNAECLYDEQTQQPHTAHTSGPVPFVYVGRKAKVRAGHKGILADIAPTILYLLGLKKPSDMTGESLIEFLP